MMLSSDTIHRVMAEPASVMYSLELDHSGQLRPVKTGTLKQLENIAFTNLKVVDSGSFGVMYQAKLVESNEPIAIKKVLHDRRFENRELTIIRTFTHRNIANLLYYYYTSGEKKDEVYLHLVSEYLPVTLHSVISQYLLSSIFIPLIFTKLYMYQLFAAVGHMHKYSICHGDIKPQNLLIDPDTEVLKLFDFGSAIFMVKGKAAGIGSRYYRAPELLLGATTSTHSFNPLAYAQTDTWSAGCVLAQLLLGQLLFQGDSDVDQFIEIMKVLGTPTKEEMQEMNPNYTEFHKFPQIIARPWNEVFHPTIPPEAIDLVSKLLTYRPILRSNDNYSSDHPFFDELKQPGANLPCGREFPPLFKTDALHLKKGEAADFAVGSRYYRAPELLLGATDYTVNIDIWSAGCVLAEMLLGQLLFQGDSDVDQFIEIMKVLGTPTKEEMQEMNPNYMEVEFYKFPHVSKFPQVKARPWKEVFRPRTSPDALDLVGKLLKYMPISRNNEYEYKYWFYHPFFDELKQLQTRLKNGRPLLQLCHMKWYVPSNCEKFSYQRV